MSLSQYPQIQPFLDYIQFEKRYAHHTIISYRNDLEQLFFYLNNQFGSLELPEITAALIRSWLAKLKDDKISSKSINRKISALKSFFKYQVKTGLLTNTPLAAIVSPKVGKRLPSFVAETEMAVLQAVKPSENASWQHSTENLVLQVFYNTGMRLSELINLAENNVDISNSQLKILGKGNKERIIPVSQALMAEIVKYGAEKRLIFPGSKLPYLFVGSKGKQLYAKSVYLAVKKHLSGVTTLKKKSPHVLRHTFATHLTNNGAELNAVKELLGHSSLASTQVYTHNTIEKLKEIHKRAHPKA